MKHTTPGHSIEEMHKTSMEMMKTCLEAFQVMTKHDRVPQTDWQDFFNVNHIYKEWFNELSQKHADLWQVQAEFLKDCLDLADSFQPMIFGKPSKNGGFWTKNN